MADRKTASNQTFTKFVILGVPRCGSNALIAGLQLNPAIEVYGELFCGEVTDRPAVHGRRYADGEPGDEFLDHVFCRPRPAEIKAVGFKWFGEQARHDPGGLAAWRRFREDRSIRVVSLERDDWLGMVVSREIASQTNVWHIDKFAASSHESRKRVNSLQRFSLSAESVAAGLRHIAYSTEMMLEDAVGHPTLRVSYTDLFRDFQGQINRITDFLGASRHPAVCSHQKINVVPLEHRVENFHSLKRHFQGTGYEPFFSRSG